VAFWGAAGYAADPRIERFVRPPLAYDPFFLSRPNRAGWEIR
jgi:hypothetical protein